MLKRLEKDVSRVEKAQLMRFDSLTFPEYA